MQSVRPCSVNALPRTIKSILNAGLVGSRLDAAGWVKSIRKQRSMTFIELNDGSSSDNLQIVSRTDSLSSSHVSAGTGLRVSGILAESIGKGQALELQAEQLEVIGACDAEYPVQKKDHSAEFLRSIPHLRNRSNIHAALTRFRSQAAQAFRSTLSVNCRLGSIQVLIRVGTRVS